MQRKLKISQISRPNTLWQATVKERLDITENEGRREHHRDVNLSFARVTQSFAKADVRQSISKGIDKWKTRDSQQTRQAEGEPEGKERGGTLSNKHRFLVHTARALAELALTRPRARRKRITEQPNQTLSLFQKDLGAGQSECRQNKSSIIRDRQRQEARAGEKGTARGEDRDRDACSTE